MDFFEAQTRAKKRTSLLVTLFLFALGGLVAAGYIAFIVAAAFLDREPSRYGFGRESLPETLAHIDLWQPGPLLACTFFVILVVGGSSLWKWLQLRAGGSAVAEMVGARQISAQTTDLRERQLLNVVEEMAIAAGVPLPPAYVLDDEIGINAFAAGLTTSDAVVAVTRGTLEKLDRDELQGVVAHEFSHILNGDMRLNTRLTAVLFGILAVGLLGRGILESLRFSRSSGRGGKGGVGGVAIVVVIGLVLLTLGYFGYFFGRILQAAVSRQRELLADASAVQFTRNPAGVAGALKKIGGYALGSFVQTNKPAELAHFFFAQGFESTLGGLWATHPSLDERIRAVEPSFDGKYFEPPTVVDVAVQTWSKAFAAPGSHFHPGAQGAPQHNPLTPVVTVGALNADHTARAQHLAANIPCALREAVRTPTEAAAVVCGLLREPNSSDELRAKQCELVRRLAGQTIATALERLEEPLRLLRPEARLPLLLLTPPALRQLPSNDFERFLETLDELVHADQRVSLFEFALQKVLARHLAIAARPTSARETLSPSDVSAEISLTLSFAARLAAIDENDTSRAFACGAAQFPGLYPPLNLRPKPACTLEALDAALDRLALAYAPVRKRVLAALAATLAHDDRIDLEEAELLRAFASALDCPMPLSL